MSSLVNKDKAPLCQYQRSSVDLQSPYQPTELCAAPSLVVVFERRLFFTLKERTSLLTIFPLAMFPFAVSSFTPVFVGYITQFRTRHNLKARILSGAILLGLVELQFYCAVLLDYGAVCFSHTDDPNLSGLQSSE